jgi:hypothetical protein
MPSRRDGERASRWGRFVGYLRAHFEGRQSLGRSFWLNGVFINICLTAGIFLAANAFHDSTVARILAFSVVTFALSLGVGVWQWVGIWRAAGARLRRRRSGWAWLARACVIYSAYTGYRGIDELARLRDFTNIEGRFQVRKLGRAGEAELVGQLKDGVSRELEGFLARNPTVTLLHVNSSGGLENEAKRVANLVREKRLRVIVDDECSSACALVLLASHERWARPTASIGFHASENFQSHRRVASSSLRYALEKVGAGPDFIESATKYDSSDVWRPGLEGLKAQRIVTHVAKPSEFTYSLLEYSSLHAETRLKTSWRIEAIERFDPPAFDQLVNDFLEGPARGRTLDEFSTQASAATERVLEEARCRAAPSVLAARFALYRALAEATASHAPAKCQETLDGRFSMPDLPEGLVKDFDRVDKLVVESAELLRNVPGSDPKVLEAAKLAFWPRLSAATVAHLTGESSDKTDRKAACEALVDYYRTFVTLDPEAMAAIDREGSCPSKGAILHPDAGAVRPYGAASTIEFK